MTESTKSSPTRKEKNDEITDHVMRNLRAAAKNALPIGISDMERIEVEVPEQPVERETNR